MNQQPAHNQVYIKSLQILCGSLIMGQLIFVAIVIYLLTTINAQTPPAITDGHDIYLGASAAVMVVAGLIAFYIYKKQLEKARNLTGSLNDKLHIYRSTIVTYLAICESGGMLSVVFLYLTGDMRLLVVTAVSLVLMVRGLVTRRKIVNELQLNWQEEQDL
jgi:hypothetical protein